MNLSNINKRTEGDINSTLARTAWLESEVNEETKILLDKDARYFLHQSMSTPCLDVLKYCEGSYIENVAGKKYLDFHGNNVHQIGYANPILIENIIKQLQTLPFSPRRFTNEPAINFAEKLASLMPSNLNRILLTPNGSSSIGIALKLARAVTKKFKVVSFWDSFHGASLDAISVGGESNFREYMGPLMPGIERIPPPITYRGIFEDNENSKEVTEDEFMYSPREGKNIFLVMVDQSKSGCIAPSLSCALDLRQRFQDQVHLLLDACQFRISKNTLKNYLEQNITVAITGSKFLAGPSFSAALLVPYQAAGLASKQKRTAINPGLLIRWQVALASWQAFQNLDSLKIKHFLQQFSSAIECHLLREPMFTQLPAPALCRDMKKTETEWDHLPTIFSFMLRMPTSNTFASHMKTLTIYQYIQQHLNPRLQLGRPIPAEKGSDGLPVGALRLCISAPMIIDAINNTQQNAIIHQGISALNQISLIVQNNLAMPNPA